MRKWLCLVMLAASVRVAVAEDFSLAWADAAGEHMGAAEAAGTCPGYRLNATRRDEVLAMYKEPRLAKELEIARSFTRADREKAVREDRRVCSGLVELYGPTGLAIANYVMKQAAKDAVGQAGIDKGLATNLDPHAVEAIHWLSMAGYATAIETVCGRRYQMAAILEAKIFLLARRIGAEDATAIAATSVAAAGTEYGRALGKSTFCGRILRDYGPAGATPVVRERR